jgi:hypothetical protein
MGIGVGADEKLPTISLKINRNCFKRDFRFDDGWECFARGGWSVIMILRY